MTKLVTFATMLCLFPIFAMADSFSVIGSIQDGFSGPATGATVTLCEYGNNNGFSTTAIVTDTGLVQAIFPYLPHAVAFEVENDPNFEDVHVLVAQPYCVVSPCQPDQNAVFMIRLQRRIIEGATNTPTRAELNAR